MYSSAFLLFVAVFFMPIMLLADKIKGGGVGFGPAFASFAIATVIVGITVLVSLCGLGGLIYHFAH